MSAKFDYQKLAVRHALDWFWRGRAAGDKLLLASPTGTGKSYVLLGIQRRFRDSGLSALIVTPSPQIALDMATKAGGGEPEELSIFTALRLRNLAISGEAPRADVLLIDEAHHAAAATWELLDLCFGGCPSIGVTATPYRGTPKSTAKFREAWGEPTWVITIPEAIRQGVWSLPICRTVPLVDDDVVTVSNGQFTVTSIESATKTRLDDAANVLDPHFDDLLWDRPTMVCVPSVALAHDFARVAAHLFPSVAFTVVTGDTPQTARDSTFAQLRRRETSIIQIGVVSEGVDLPIRRILDLHPMLSPVEWLQQFGRITRPVGPGEPPPEYIVTNRNLMRHAYLLEGALPSEAIRDAEKAFGSPSKRAGMRAVGLECLGRFKASELPLAGDVTGSMYLLSSPEGRFTRQYACLLHPSRAEPIWASRSNEKTDDPMKPVYGRWRRCDPPADVSGFASVPPSQCTEKMVAWWKRDAARRGLDPDAEVSRKNFAALPILTDLREKL